MLHRRCLPLVVLALAACAGAGESELQRAIKDHDPDRVAELLAAGASPYPTVAEQLGAGELALYNVGHGEPGSVEVLRLLLAADPQPFYLGPSALRPPPRRLVDATFTRYRGKKVDHGHPEISAVEIVTIRASPDGVRALLDAGLDLGSEGVANALVDAARSGRHEIARLLLAAGADPNGRSTVDLPLRWPPLGLSPLEAAIEADDRAMVDLLVTYGAR